MIEHFQLRKGVDRIDLVIDNKYVDAIELFKQEPMTDSETIKTDNGKIVSKLILYTTHS